MTGPKSMAKGSEYRCARCGGVYIATDFDADTERDANFPDMKDEPCEIVCDDCYKELHWLMS